MVFERKMQLENLLRQLEDECQEEISRLEAESSDLLSEIDRKGQEGLRVLQDKNKKLLVGQREKALNNFLQERTFESKMKLLGYKYELFENAVRHVEEKISYLPEATKKEIFAKELEVVKALCGKDNRCAAFVPMGKRQFFADLFSSLPAGLVQEKELEFGDGFVVEGEGFVFALSLSGMVRRKILEEQSHFFLLLFGE